MGLTIKFGGELGESVIFDEKLKYSDVLGESVIFDVKLKCFGGLGESVKLDVILKYSDGCDIKFNYSEGVAELLKIDTQMFDSAWCSLS